MDFSRPESGGRKARATGLSLSPGVGDVVNIAPAWVRAGDAQTDRFDLSV
jgi:hypothetical protein